MEEAKQDVTQGIETNEVIENSDPTQEVTRPIQAVPQAQSDVRGKSDPNKVLYILLALVVILLLVLSIGMFTLVKKIGGTSVPVQTASSSVGTAPQGYSTDQNRGTLISQGAYKVNQSFERYGFKVTVDAVQFTGTDAKVYLTINNNDTHSVEFMANETASLVDQNGNISNARPFSGENQFNGTIPPNGVSTGWIDFQPVKSTAKTLTLNIPRVFDLNHPSFTVTIPFSVPGK